MLTPMAKLKHVELVGNMLRAHFEDGSTQTGVQFSTELFKFRAVGGGDNSSGGGGYGKYALVNPLPESIGPITDYNGTHTLTGAQIKNAADIIAAAAQYPGITDDIMRACIVCALVESVMRVYANSNVPESFNYQHEAVGSDHLSVGLFQQQVPDFGWGSVRDCMTTRVSTWSFIGGPSGPRGGAAPSGLVDRGRDNYATIGEWVQAVQISAHPARYDESMEAVDTILDALIVKTPPGGGGGTGSMTQPFEPDAYDASDPFGSMSGGRRYPHTGSDYNQGIGSGTDAMMISDGVVESVGFTSFNGWHMSVKMDESPWYWAFIHGLNRPSISEGTRVTKGQTGIFRVGNTGTNSRGAHLHITLSDTVNAYQGMGNLQDPWAFIEARR